MSNLLIFRCGKEEFGLPIEVIREVRRIGKINPVPHAPDFVEGIIFLAEHPIAMVNLSRRLGLDGQKRNEMTRFIIAKTHGVVVGLIVDAVLEVIEVSEKNIETTPELALPVDDGYVRKVVNLSGRVVLILNLDEVLSPEEASHIQTIKKEARQGTESANNQPQP